MKELHELIYIIHRNRVKSIEIIGNPPPRKSKAQEFYEKLTDGSITSDEEAAIYFYGSTPQDRRYKDLKNRLKERLYNTSLFIDLGQKNMDDLGRAYYSGWKEMAVAKILMGREASASVVHVLRNILRKSLRYDLTLLGLECIRMLRVHYATAFFDEKSFRELETDYQRLRTVFLLEQDMEDMYVQLTLLAYGKKLDENDRIYHTATTFCDQMQQVVEQYDTYRLRLYYYVIRLIGYQANGNLALTQANCEEALDYFQHFRFTVNNAVGIFMRQLFILYWQQGQLEKAKTLLQRAEIHSSEQGIGWFANYRYYILSCLYTGEYDEAWVTYHAVISRERFAVLPEYYQENWRIFGAYLEYLRATSHLPLRKPNRHFRLYKFLNEVPRYSRDKQGYNIPVLIIQILFMLQQKKYDQVIDRMEALEKYAQRYLRQDETIRSYYFLKMLLKIPEADFQAAGAQRKAAGFYQKLKSVPLDVAYHSIIVEILPYETLWEMALASLETPKK
ncbi:MAG: hypothetical protein H6555_10130 [Lewinellaceae bacterium]|nr:hypothetical protein [Lewinellaceae bacterium]